MYISAINWTYMSVADPIQQILNVVTRQLAVLALLLGTLPASAQWFDTYEDGPSVFDGEYASVNDMVEDSRGFLWMATASGLLRYDGYDHVMYRPQPGDSNSLSSTTLTCLAVVNDSLLAIGTGSGLIEFFNIYTGRSRKVSIYEKDEHNRSTNLTIRDVFADGDENVWVGGQLGLTKVNPHTGQSKRFKGYDFDQPINSWPNDPNLLWVVQADLRDPNILLLAGQGGFFRFDMRSEQFLEVDSTITPVNKFIQDTLRDRIVVTGWYDGLLLRDNATGQYTPVSGGEHFTGSIVLGRLGDNTVFVYQPDEGFGTLELTSDRLTFGTDGTTNPWLAGEYVFKAFGGFYDQNHTFWVFARYHQWQFKNHRSSTDNSGHTLLVTSLSTARSERLLVRPDESVKLPVGATELKVTFALVNPAVPEEIHYRYRSGKGQWIELGEDRTVLFSNLKHGNQSVEFQAISTQSQEALAEVWLDFDVDLPFLQRPSTMIVIGLLALLLIILLLMLRQKQVRAARQLKDYEARMTELELKALRSQMNPHFMFNSLNSIKNYILQAEPRIAAEYLSNFAHLIRMILQNSRAKLITLQEELETLMLYIDLEKLRFDDEFEFNCIIDDRIDMQNVTIPPMILQPYVENAIWHGLMHKEDRGQLTLKFHKHDGGIDCIVEDNGVGRKAASALKDKSIRKYKSMGMGITQDRIDIINKMNELGIQTRKLKTYTMQQGQSLQALRVTVTVPENGNIGEIILII